MMTDEHNGSYDQEADHDKSCQKLRRDHAAPVMRLDITAVVRFVPLIAWKAKAPLVYNPLEELLSYRRP